MTPRAAVLVIACCAAVAPSCAGPQRPVEFGPHMDRAAALARIDTYRREFAQNRRTVEACEAASPAKCKADRRCVATIAFGDHGTGGPAACRATGLVLHAFLQERSRRLCDRSRDGVWSVYQLTSDRTYGDCVCPRPTLEAFIADGDIVLSESDGRCLTERERCRARGGTLRSPRRVPAPSSQLLVMKQGPSRTRHDCEDGIHAYSTVNQKLFVHPQWIDDARGGRCELVVLEGFLVPRVRRGPHYVAGNTPDVETVTHLCEGARRR